MMLINRKILVDDFQMVAPGHSKNFPKLIDSVVIEQWAEPNQTGTLESGKEFAKTEDGRTFWRYDCYDPRSPYGWSQCKEEINATQSQGPASAGESQASPTQA